jgi:predicted nucleotidyltransferase
LYCIVFFPISQALNTNFLRKEGTFLKTVGIICEYNPLHRGHEKQIRYLKEQYPDSGVVCLMSGNFVQRGHPAIFDKSLRAQAAVLAGADLVIELPISYTLSSAEGFAAGGVSILGQFCDTLCFGSETGNADALLSTAQSLLAADFPDKLRQYLDQGLSFPAARQAALGESGALLRNPNDILAVEYCKAILAQNSQLQPLPIFRPGSYHDTVADTENPSATAVRELILSGQDWMHCVSEEAAAVFAGAVAHHIYSGQQAILYRLRTMTDEEFEALPYGSEGLWRKFMHACRNQATLEAIIAATKSKRYTRTRIDRMVMCAFLGISREILEGKPPYARILALNATGRIILKQARQTQWLPNAGEKLDHPYQQLEQKCDDLYSLFVTGIPEPPNQTDKRRIFYLD